MSDSIASAYRPFLEAISFASRAHHGQTRKDGQTPYASHVFRVCMVLRHVFEVADARILTAAVLHDAIEDTTTDFDDVKEKFGTEIATWVASLSKDKRLAFEPREAAYCQTLAESPWQVQVCKLADVFDNLLDMDHLSADNRPKALANKRLYVQAIHGNLKPEVAHAWNITHQLLEELERKSQRKSQGG